MTKNKLIRIKMNKFKIFSIAFIATVSVSNAQDLNAAKKAIDAEQYEKAKSILKSTLQSKPSNGAASFLLGNVYLIQSNADSAKICYQKGLTASDGARFNYIGLGTIDLDNGNPSAAQANFVLALKDAKKKDVDELVSIGRAYIYSTKPDYKKAIEVLNKAKVINPNDALVQLALGNAYFGDNNQNDATAAYNTAFSIDPTLLRAKMQKGVLLKNAQVYDLSIGLFNEVIAMDPNYGPVYRELAETYYKWGINKPSKKEENMKKAVGYYDKYISLTDMSMNSRMRQADFLISAKEYKTLESVANGMVKMDKANPRLYRYLGYSALENGNYDVAISSLETFTSNPSNKIIAQDYLNLGLAKIKKGTSADGKTIDPVFFNKGIVDINKSVTMEVTMTNDLSDVGKKLYEQKLYKEAAAIFELAVSNKESKNYATDNFYLGNSYYYDNTRKEVVKPDPIALQKADLAYGNVITVSPTTQDAYIFRARVNSLLDNDPMTIKYYEDYIASATAKGAEELAKPAVVKKFIESNNAIGASYANTDKAKAVTYFNKTLVIDPTNQYALDSLKSLK